MFQISMKNLAFLLFGITQLCTLANDNEKNPGPNTERNISNLKICHINIQSMKRNSDKVKHISLQLGNVYDIITVSETWLS